MKKRLLVKAVVGSLLALLLLNLTACSAGVGAGRDLMDGIKSASVLNTGENTDDLTKSAQKALYNFSVQLLQNTAQNGESALVSPWSVITALGMTANGAAGDTLAQMSAVLGLKPDELGAYLHAYAETLKEDKCLHAANGIWLRDEENLTVEKDFLQKNADYYDALAVAAPFDDSTVQDINEFVKDNTNGQIEKILDELSSDAMLVLVNALGFDAQWKEIYREDQVHDSTFTKADGTLQDPVPFMYSEESVFLQDGSFATGFLKHYEGERYAFAALLPSEGTNVDAYLAGLTGDRLQSILNKAEETMVAAGIPKFHSEGHYNLNHALCAMGMPGAFTPNADFSAMGHYADMGLYISKVLHETSITVDEQGTKAGAATAVVAEAGAAEDVREVVLNRPFVYLLVDTEWNMPLFIGTLQQVQGED